MLSLSYGGQDIDWCCGGSTMMHCEDNPDSNYLMASILIA